MISKSQNKKRIIDIIYKELEIGYSKRPFLGTLQPRDYHFIELAISNAVSKFTVKSSIPAILIDGIETGYELILLQQELSRYFLTLPEVELLETSPHTERNKIIFTHNVNLISPNNEPLFLPIRYLNKIQESSGNRDLIIIGPNTEVTDDYCKLLKTTGKLIQIPNILYERKPQIFYVKDNQLKKERPSKSEIAKCKNSETQSEIQSLKLIDDFITHEKLNNKTVYIYGAGLAGLCVEERLSNMDNITIKAYVDSFKSGKFNGHPILSLPELKSKINPDDMVLICSAAWREISENLKAENITNILIG